ncbi:MAG: hypothetical protein JKY56_11870 [Kofleriaceae bacterium]|nr:hypothetical protein [Kofleriaceae bacterium]
MANSPYRAAIAQSLFEAPTALGIATLHFAPKHLRLEVGAQVWTIGNDTISVVTQGKRRAKRKSIVLEGAHLYMAKAWPTGEISVWVERKGGAVQRLLGLQPVIGMDQRAIEGWRQLDRLAAQLKRALSDYTRGSTAFEFGRGGHRVLTLKYAERMVVFARPIFRENPRRVVEVYDDGTIALPKRKKDDVRVEMRKGVEVIASGDRICFCRPDGLQVAAYTCPG